MRFASVQLLLLCLFLPGCDTFFVGFVSNPGGGTMSISGTVSIVRLQYLRDPAGVTTFTAVTFVNSGTSTTINFCGDQGSSFPINRFVRADFSTGLHCSTLIAVVISP